MPQFVSHSQEENCFFSLMVWYHTVHQQKEIAMVWYSY